MKIDNNRSKLQISWIIPLKKRKKQYRNKNKFAKFQIDHKGERKKKQIKFTLH